jgi:Domain of unknown function (DUF1707)
MTAEFPPASPGPRRDVAPLPGPRRGVAPPLRASHADRDLAVDILCAAAGDGRLTAAELDERLETALTARTVGELATVTADLPDGTMLRAAGRRHPAQVTRRCFPVYADDPAASRWTLLRSLLDA